MYTYRIVLDAYNSRSERAKSARIVTYSHGYNRADALRRIKTIYIASCGKVSDGFTEWPGERNLPTGRFQSRHLPEWEVVSIRSVGSAGTPRILSEAA